MAQGANYNLISPFGSFGGSASNPALPVGPGTGWYYDANNNLGAAVNGTEVAYFNQDSQLVLPQQFAATASTVSGISFGSPGNSNTPILFRNGNQTLQVGVGDFSTNAKLAAAVFLAANSSAYIPQYYYSTYSANGMFISGTTVNFVYANIPVLAVSTLGMSYYTQIQAYNTVTFTPGTLSSTAFVIAAQSGATTVNVTLPTTVVGLTYSVGVFTTGATVIISPQSANDQLVWCRGSTPPKSAGASTVSGLQYSSITFVCVTTSLWYATSFVGTWL